MIDHASRYLPFLINALRYLLQTLKVSSPATEYRITSAAFESDVSKEMCEEAILPKPHAAAAICKGPIKVHPQKMHTRYKTTQN